MMQSGKQLLTLILGVGISFYLVSCASMRTPSSSSASSETTTGAPAKQVPWKEREPALSAIKSWHISGKLAVQTPQQSGSATVDWTQRGNQFYISILGPLGAGGVKLYGRHPGQVTLQTADGKVFTDTSPEQLLAKRSGYHLPVSNLVYWIRGLPSPNLSMSTRYDAAGRLNTLIQQGWVIQYLSYVHRGNMDLPDKIAISSPSLKVKMAIYGWQTG